MLQEIKFEQGPIRPPSEAYSLLLRTTRGCPWNQCTFCSAYNEQKFSIRSVAEIKADIETAKRMADEIQERSCKLEFNGEINSRLINQIFKFHGFDNSCMNVAMWLCHNTGGCFLQDADNLVMRTTDLIEILSYLRTTFPEIKRVTTYSRSRTIVSKTLEELREIKEAGLDRIHVGLESGSDQVLRRVKKGVTRVVHIQAGKRVVEAGIELSEYVIPGLGGQELWEEHAHDTADVLNQINPHFIRLRSLRVPERISLYRDMQAGKFKQSSDDMVIQEIRLMIESLEGITSTIASDHILNILGDVSGVLPDDKEKMLSVITQYEALPPDEKIIFRIGRRGGAYHSVGDLYNDPTTRAKIKKMIRQIRQAEGDEGVESLIKEMADTLS